MANEFIMRKGYKSLANSEITGSLTTTGDIDTSGNLYLKNNKTVFAKNTSGSNYGLLTITSGNVIKLGAYSYTSAATQIGLGNNGTFLIGTETAFSIANNKNATFAGTVTAATAFIADAISGNNNDPGADNLQVSGYGLIGNRTNLYITNASTNSAAIVQIGVGGTHNAAAKLSIGVSNSSLSTNFKPGSDSAYDIGSNASRWANVYADNLYGDGSNLTNVTGIVPSNMVTTDTTQSITGAKTLSSLTLSNQNPAITLIDSSGSTYTAQWRFKDNKLQYLWGGGIKAYFTTDGLAIGDQDSSNDAQIVKTGSSPYGLAIKTNNIQALNVDASQNATFAGNVTLGGGALQSYHANVTSALALDDQISVFTRANQMFLGNNFYYGASDGGIAIEADKSSLIQIDRDKIRFFFAASVSAGASASLQEKFRLDDTGKLTIPGRVDAATMSIADTGTLDSSVKLRVAGNLQLGSDNSGGAITKIYESSGLNLDSGNASRNIYFRINGTEKLKIDTSGNATFAGTVGLSSNKSVNWPGGTIRAEGNTLKLTATTLIDLQEDTQIQGGLDIKQTSDSDGLQIFGYDDRAADSGNLYIDGSGNFQIRQTHGAGSGYMQIHAENYLELAASSLIYTQANFRIYDAGTLSFGSGGDYKIKHNTVADNLIIHTDDNKGITIDNAGNVTFTEDVVVAGKVTAQEFHTEFVSASIMYESGSTKFGDTSGDNHDFTGSVNIKGDLSVTGTVPTWNQNTTGTATTASNAMLLDGINSTSFLRSDQADSISYAAGTAEMLKFANSTSGGIIQIGFQQSDADGMHHRAYFKAYKAPNTSGNATGKFDIIVRSSGGGLTADILELEAGQDAKWQNSKIWTEGNDGPTSGLAAQTAATATTATRVTINSDFSGTYPMLVEVESSGDIYNNPSVTYNGTSDTLTSPNFSGNLTGNVTGNVTGNAGTVTNGVYTTGNQTIAGDKTFSGTLEASGTVKNVLSQHYVEIYIYGDDDKYYPVTIGGASSHYGYQKYHVSRRYNWTAPSTWNTATHMGALSLTWEHGSDTAWGGNDKEWRVIQFDEVYTTVCNGLILPVTEGMVVWLRGGGTGGARYRVSTPQGAGAVVKIYDNKTSGASGAGAHVASTTFTSGNGTAYAAESYSSSNVDSRIKEYWPIRGKTNHFRGQHQIYAAIDEDNFASNSATRVPTQQSTKAYIATQIQANTDTQDLSISGQTLSLTDGGSVTLPSDYVSAANGGTFADSINVHGNILLTGAATTTNQSRTIDFTGFDKEGTTDPSDRAYIRHTVNTGGHAGSVLVISSQNDVGDGIAFSTHASSLLRHNGNAIFSTGHKPTFAEIETTPTTIAGYGITDALVIGTTSTTAMAGNITIPSGNSVIDWTTDQGSTNIHTNNVVGYINTTEPNEPFNPFAGQKFHDGVLTNALAGRHDRFVVTIDGTTEAGASLKLSNQNFEEYNQNRLFGTSAGETKVFNINIQSLASGSPATNGITYSAGFFDINFYSSPFPASWSARVKNKDGNWTTVSSLTKIGNSKLRGVIPIGNWLTDIEFTLTARTSAPFVTGNITYGISEFELFFSRMTASQGGNISSLGGYLGGTITTAGGTTSTNWNTAYTHSTSTHAPTNAEPNVQADWNETTTTSDAFILNKPTIPSAITDYVSKANGGTFSGNILVNAQLAVNSTTVNAANKLEVHGQARVNGKMMIGDSTISNVPNAAVQLHVKNAGQAGIRLEDSDSSNLAFDVIVDEGVGFLIKETVGGDAGDDVRLTIAESTGAVTIGGTLGSGAITSTGKISGTELEGTSLDINGNADISGNINLSGAGARIIESGGDIALKTGSTASTRYALYGAANGNTNLYYNGVQHFRTGPNGVVVTGDAEIGAGKYTLTVNAPTSLTTSVVNDTINVTFTASTTTNIDNYLIFSSVAGGDYGLISVIPPADFGATMSIIDDSFNAGGTQAYRVYAVKNGVYSSPLTGSQTFTVGTVEPTNLSVVNLNTAYYIQYDVPSAKGRFVSSYNIYKHEHATASSLARASATLVYSGINNSYMYAISGVDNNNFHQFWVEVTTT